MYKQFMMMTALVLCLAGRGFALTVGASSGIPTGLVSEIQKDIKDIDDKPEDFIKAFADASVFASFGATQRAYGEYKLFAFTVGTIVGARLPGSPFSAVKDIQDAGDTLKDKGDLKAGVNIQAVNLQLGINTSSFLLNGLYLGIRFGYFDLKAVDNLEFKTLHIGLVGNYQLIKGAGIGSFLKWRGVAVGTGFLFQKTTLEYTYDLGSFNNGGFETKPTLNFDMNVTTYTIPLEVNTSVLLVWILNFNLGAGVDIAFGKNSTDIGMTGAVYQTGANVGSVWAKGGGSMSPTILNPKVMANLGLKLGPVILDVPLTWYFAGGSGISAGVTLGAVW